jgi:hypothetical protein
MPAEVVGPVSDEGAARTGLPRDVPVVMGATDSFCQLLGVGVSRPGDALVYYGSTGTLMVPTVDLARAVGDGAAFGEDAPYRLAAYLRSCGTFLDHLREVVLGRSPLAELDELASDVPPGSDGLLALPWLAATEEEGASSAGALVGLTLAHGRGHLWRAALEAFGYVLMEARDRLDAPLGHVVAAGGGSASATWRSIVTDQTGWSQTVAPEGGAARGAAFLAALGTGAVVVILAVLWLLPASGVHVLKDYQAKRITGFTHPDSDPAGATYNVAQSINAVGAGGVKGRGEAGATQTNLNFLPEHATDFAFASLAEQRGFVGVSVLLLLYLLVVWRGLKVIAIARDAFSAIAAGGIVFALLFQVFVNVGMNIGVAPVTGIPLPFVSVGGSALIANLLAMGVLQAIYARGAARPKAYR